MPVIILPKEEILEIFLYASQGLTAHFGQLLKLNGCTSDDLGEFYMFYICS